MLSKKLAAIDKTRCVACGVCVKIPVHLGPSRCAVAATPPWRRNAA